MKLLEGCWQWVRLQPYLHSPATHRQLSQHVKGCRQSHLLAGWVAGLSVYSMHAGPRHRPVCCRRLGGKDRGGF
jgi:hypothetical protein